MKNSLSKIGLNVVAMKNQLHHIRPTLLASFAIGLGGSVLAYALSRLMDVPPGWLTRDPADITELGFYIGMLSNFGLMSWSAATAICFWAASLLRHDGRLRESVYFLSASGLLSLLLMLDDAFIFHERVLPRLLDIPEDATVWGYPLIMLGYGGYFFRRILKTDYLLLVLSLFFLGFSAAMDQFLPFSDLEAFWEDCPKFLGIVLWLAYFSQASLNMAKDGFTGSVMKEQKKAG